MNEGALSRPGYAVEQKGGHFAIAQRLDNFRNLSLSPELGKRPRIGDLIAPQTTDKKCSRREGIGELLRDLGCVFRPFPLQELELCNHLANGWRRHAGIGETYRQDTPNLAFREQVRGKTQLLFEYEITTKICQREQGYKVLSKGDTPADLASPVNPHAKVFVEEHLMPLCAEITAEVLRHGLIWLSMPIADEDSSHLRRPSGGASRLPRARRNRQTISYRASLSQGMGLARAAGTGSNLPEF